MGWFGDIAKGLVNSGLNSLTGGLFSAGSSFLGNLFGNGPDNDAAKAFAKQKELKQMDQVFAREMAEYQNQQSKEMWQLNNDYNSPVSQVSRLRAAGLNPDLMYSGGAGSLGTASAPSMSGGNGVSGGDASYFANVGLIKAQTRLANAQASAVGSQVQKNTSETEGVNLDNTLKQATLQNNITLSGITVASAYQGLSLSKTQQQLAIKQIEHTDLLCKELKTNIESLNEDITSKKLHNKLTSETLDDVIKFVKNNTKLSDVQLQNLDAVLKSQIFNNNASGSLSVSQSALNNLDLSIFKSDYRGQSFRRAMLEAQSMDNMYSLLNGVITGILNWLNNGGSLPASLKKSLPHGVTTYTTSDGKTLKFDWDEARKQGLHSW